MVFLISAYNIIYTFIYNFFYLLIFFPFSVCSIYLYACFSLFVSMATAPPTLPNVVCYGAVQEVCLIRIVLPTITWWPQNKAIVDLILLMILIILAVNSESHSLNLNYSWMKTCCMLYHSEMFDLCLGAF